MNLFIHHIFYFTRDDWISIDNDIFDLSLLKSIVLICCWSKIWRFFTSLTFSILKIYKINSFFFSLCRESYFTSKKKQKIFIFFNYFVLHFFWSFHFSFFSFILFFIFFAHFIFYFFRLFYFLFRSFNSRLLLINFRFFHHCSFKKIVKSIWVLI